MRKQDYRHWYEDARYAPKAAEAPRACDVPGCTGEGTHKAPKQRDIEGGPREYHWFCLPHVTEFNKRWDYFRGMKPEEVERFQRESITGHRPTWRMGAGAGSPQDILERKLHMFMHGEEVPIQPAAVFRLKPKYRKALEVLELQWPINEESLKKAFKAMAKRTHPDLHPNDPSVAERFKEITHAYQLLQKGLQAAEMGE